MGRSLQPRQNAYGISLPGASPLEMLRSAKQGLGLHATRADPFVRLPISQEVPVLHPGSQYCKTAAVALPPYLLPASYVDVCF